jgi:hypothetical protein
MAFFFETITMCHRLQILIISNRKCLPHAEKGKNKEQREIPNFRIITRKLRKLL